MMYEVNLHAQKQIIIEAPTVQTAVALAENTHAPFRVSSLVEVIPRDTPGDPHGKCYGVVGHCHRCKCAIIGGVTDYLKNQHEEMFCVKCALVTLKLDERQAGQG